MYYFLFVLAITAIGFAQPITPDSVWTFAFDDGGDEYFYDAIEVDDGYLLCGEWREWNALAGHGLMVKIDRDGELVWARRYPNGAPFRFRYIIDANDDGTQFEILGEVLSASGIAEDIRYLSYETQVIPEYDFTICNLPMSLGTTTASATIDDGSWPYHRRAEIVTRHYFDRDTLEHVRTDDGDHQCILVLNFGEYEINDGLWYSNIFSSVVLGGYRRDTVAPFHAQGFLGFISSGGSWEFGGAADDVFNAVFMRDTNPRLWGFGWTESFGNGGRDLWILGYDETPETDTISVTYGGPSNEDAVEAFLDTDDGFIIAGNFSSEDIEFEQSDFWLLKVDANGDSVWSVVAGGAEADRCEGMIPLQYGYLLFGSSQSFAVPGWDACAMYIGYGPDLAVAPASLNFGPVAVGDSATRTLHLINSGSRVLGINWIENADDYHVYYDWPVSIEVGETLSVQAVFAPLSAGTHVDTLRVVSTASSGVKIVRCIGAGTAVDADEHAVLPMEFKLYPAYPNPFNPSTMIEFDLAKSGNVELAIFDIQGRVVEELVSGNLSAGTHAREWTCSTCAGGVYFARLSTSEFVGIQKLVLLK